ncbi:hypothetical protein [Acetatifactor muris]|uniref:hypothetical protein n=1 Tax=Acetatifactor muris TaxID=879566 RepID=UPI0023F42DB3|nr:hypothetical protein [Acetatifactor muris]
MEKLRAILFMAGLMLFLLAAVTGFLSVQDYLDILPAESYEDKGVYTFRPYQVLPVQVENTGTGREKRMNPTKTVYMVYYRDTEAKGYRWEERAVSRESGEKTVDAGVTVERRVLSILSSRAYITVAPELDAERYTAGLRRRDLLLLGASAAYILLYLGAWCVLWYRRRKSI